MKQRKKKKILSLHIKENKIQIQIDKPNKNEEVIEI